MHKYTFLSVATVAVLHKVSFSPLDKETLKLLQTFISSLQDALSCAIACFADGGQQRSSMSSSRSCSSSVFGLDVLPSRCLTKALLSLTVSASGSFCDIQMQCSESGAAHKLSFNVCSVNADERI